MKHPEFKYNPRAYDLGLFKRGEFTCDCCGEQTDMIYGSGIYTAHDPQPKVCPECLANGAAAEKFSAQFVNSGDSAVTDEEKIDELLHRTPGYPSWQGDFFPACCGDFCAFIEDVGTAELEEMGIADEVFEDWEARGGDPYDREVLVAVGSTAGYLFQCLHCGRYHLHVDND